MAEQQENQFHNSSFKDFVMNLKGLSYGYSIDKDDDGTIELSIYSTSLSELDDTHLESGHLDGFSYLEKEEAEDDLGSANLFFGLTFEEVDNTIND